MTVRKITALAAIGLALALVSISTGRAEEKTDPVATLNVPKMTDDQIAVAAENLRKEGAAGLERAHQAYFGWMIRCSSGGGDPAQHAKQEPRWHRLIDLTAQQKDADVSRLFWHTDWDSAQAEAQRTGKPVLRLFMMGRLTDNLSCANSRFFRVALYANASISSLLRERYILCWTSVRPVPVITVDYGDGRKLERTITGNSIHYVVNAEGQLLDVMPGLVSPQTFETWLQEGLRKHEELASLPEQMRSEPLRRDFQIHLESALTSWRQLLDPIAPDWTPTAPISNFSPSREEVSVATTPSDRAQTPTAIEAAPRAASKAFVESPLVEQVVDATDVPKALPEETAAPTAVEAAPISRSKLAVEIPLVNSVVLNTTPVLEPPPFDLEENQAPVVAPTAFDAIPLAIGKGRLERPLVAELAPPASEPPVVIAEPAPQSAEGPAPAPTPEALLALPIATSKSGVELPLVRSTVGREEIPRLIAETTEQDWNRIAETFADGSRLDETSKNLMNRLHSDPEAPTGETCPSSTIESFERSIALDTARNVYLHRRAILEWILDDGLPTDLVAFNERVYGELFLTPSNDPWIGLVPADVFTGIEGEGLFGN